MTDIRDYNRRAWDRQVEQGNPWTLPVDSATIAAARRGEWSVVLTPSIPVPREWFGPLAGRDVLCLASGGGQQGPILAAAGAHVTVFDNSPRQLAQDRLVADREGLDLATVEGDMRDLGLFGDASFDLIFHPVSNIFIPDVRPVWREAFRVLRPGGVLLAGLTNPVRYLFDLWKEEAEGILQVKHTLPYSDVDSLSPEQKQEFAEKGWPMEFSHTLDDQIGGQLAAGFVLTGFFEDGFAHPSQDLLSTYTKTFMATRALKPE